MSESTLLPRFSRWQLLALLSLTLLAYRPVLGAGFIWDDDSHVAANATLRNLQGLQTIWTDPSVQAQYYPLTFTSFWIEYHLWGLHPGGYHLVNILLHAVNAVLVWRLLLLLGVPGAWWAAAVFALHPVHVESVAWISERKNVLSALCALVACLSYLRFAEPMADRRSRRRAYLISLVSFVGALLSKTVVCLLPVVVALLIWWKRGRLTRQDVASLTPFVVIGAVFAWLTVWCEQRHVLAEWAGGEWNLSWAARLLIAGRAVWCYVGKLLWPVRLTFIYPRWPIDPHVWTQWLAPIAAAAVFLGFWGLRHRLGRGPLAAGGGFVVLLAPALGFVNYFPMRFSFVADHFQYHASIALITAGVAMGTAQVRRLGGRGVVMGGLAGGLVLLVLGILTWRQGQIYQDAERVWRDTLNKNPSAWIACNNLGVVLMGQQGRTEEAISYFRRTIWLKPTYAEARNNVGSALVRRATELRAAQSPPRSAVEMDVAGLYDDAIAELTEALRLKPDYPEAHYNLGGTLMTRGQFDDAIAHYTEALRLKPDFAEAHNNLGVAFAAVGNLQGALTHCTEALRLKPDYPDARENLNDITGRLREPRSSEGAGDAMRGLTLRREGRILPKS